MDNKTRDQVIKLYNEGLSIKKIVTEIKGRFGREVIRQNLKKAGVNMRGRGTKYKPADTYDSSDSEDFAELLGLFYGDGHLSRNKNPAHGLYDCTLTFAQNESDLVNRATLLTEKVFGFKPSNIRKEGYFSLKFRRSFARYLHEFGYPVGKKSVINPCLPLKFLKNNAMRSSFIRGFLNAEASINDAVSIQQSVRIELPKESIEKLKSVGKECLIKNMKCHFINWHTANSIVQKPVKSNALIDLQALLEYFGIKSRIYPVRVYVGSKDKTSIHFELCIPRKFIKRLIDQNLISCEKKLNKLKMAQG